MDVSSDRNDAALSAADESTPEPQESVVEMGAAPEPALTPEPDPVVELEPEPDPVVELEQADEPVLEISHSDLPVEEETPPGLSFDAFKDIKPVAFGAAAVEDEAPGRLLCSSLRDERAGPILQEE